ncbi:MAG: DEAD-like helicases family protein, partial [Harvfovirus sp.]
AAAAAAAVVDSDLDVSEKKKGKVKLKEKVKKGGGKTGQQIRLDATNARVTKAVQELLGTFKKGDMTDAYGLDHSKYTELIAITLMYCAWFVLCGQPERYVKRGKSEVVIELIVGIKKFIGNCKGYKGKSALDECKLQDVSEVMIADLNEWLEKLVRKFPFDGLVVYNNAAHLLHHTKYDSVIPSCGIAPRQNQIDLVTTVKANLTSGYLIFYRAMMASGKTTTAAICLPVIIDELNKAARAKGYLRKCELLYVCNQVAVKGQVASTAYNSGIKFAVAYSQHGHVRIINHNSTSDADRSLVICSPDVGATILEQEELRVKKEGGYNRYMLFSDELTIGAAFYGSQSLIDNTKVMMFMPSHTILASATLPTIDKLEKIVGHYKKRFPLGLVKDIYSSRIEIGCDMKTFMNERVMPHLGCKTIEELKIIIETINKNPFLGRLYTSQITKFLWDKLNEKRVKNLPDIREIFSDVANLSLDKVRQECMKMLRLLTTTTDELVAEICATTITDLPLGVVVKEEKDEDDAAAVFDDGKDDAVEIPEYVSFDMLGTYQAYRYVNMNLVVDSDPVTFAMTHFKPLLDYLAKLGCESANKIYAAYKEDREEMDKVSIRMEKRIKNETKRSKQQQEMADDQSPKINFPVCCQINTLEHVKEFARDQLANVNVRELRTAYPLELIPYESFNVPDWVILLLYAGVGIYSPTSVVLDAAYQKTVLSMAATGSLAYLIADMAIAYGTNYPFYREFITKKFTDEFKFMNMWVQLWARVGRAGKSYKAEIFLDKSAAAALLHYANDPENSTVNVEPMNMERTFEDLVLLKETEEKTVKGPEEKVHDAEERNNFLKLDALYGSKIRAGCKAANVIPLSQVVRKDVDDDDEGVWRKEEPVAAAAAAAAEPKKPPPRAPAVAAYAAPAPAPAVAAYAAPPQPKSSYLPPHMRKR